MINPRMVLLLNTEPAPVTVTALPEAPLPLPTMT